MSGNSGHIGCHQRRHHQSPHSVRKILHEHDHVGVFLIVMRAIAGDVGDQKQRADSHHDPRPWPENKMRQIEPKHGKNRMFLVLTGKQALGEETVTLRPGPPLHPEKHHQRPDRQKSPAPQIEGRQETGNLSRRHHHVAPPGRHHRTGFFHSRLSNRLDQPRLAPGNVGPPQITRHFQETRTILRQKPRLQHSRHRTPVEQRGFGNRVGALPLLQNRGGMLPLDPCEFLLAIGSA